MKYQKAQREKNSQHLGIIYQTTGGYLQILGISLHIKCCVPYIAVLPKWLLVFIGSSHILTELSSSNLILVGTSLTGPSFIVTVEVPLKVVELFATSGFPLILKSDIVCLCGAVPSVFII